LKIEISTPFLACLTDSNTITDEAWLQRLGQRLAQLRLAKNLTQAQLAEQAGLGLRTVQRLELGASATQLSGFLRVCRVLGLVERLDLLVPEAVASPMAQLKQAVRKRRRASGNKAPFSLPGPWTWGERA
jgi:transcriptional regulator with XRE-family HTH domain